MRKSVLPVLACVLILLSGPGSALAAGGKVTPFDWGRKVDLNDLGGPMPFEDSATATAIIVTDTSVYGHGVIKVTRADGTTTGLKEDLELHDGDKIETDGNCALELVLSDGSAFILGPDTSIRVGSLNLISQTFNLVWGTAWVKLFKTEAKYKKKFEIRTNNAGGAPRGTEFLVSYVPDRNETSFYLHEGLLDAFNLKGDTKELRPSDTIVIASDGTMTSGRMTDEEWEQMTQKTVPFPGSETPTVPAVVTEPAGLVASEAAAESETKNATWLIALAALTAAGLVTGLVLHRRCRKPRP